MYFSDNSGLHEVEKMMCKIPNFRPRGHGSRVLRKDMEECIRSQPPPDSYEQMMEVTMAAIHYPPFTKLGFIVLMPSFASEHNPHTIFHYGKVKFAAA